MGYKAVVIIDLDHMDNMNADPAEFVRRFQMAVLTHRRLGGAVSMGGATIANVVWSGHADLSPVLKFQDFRAVNVTYGVSELLGKDPELLGKATLPFKQVS